MEKPKGGSRDQKKWLVWESDEYCRFEIYAPREERFYFPLRHNEFYFDNYWDAYAYCTKLNAERRNKGAS